MNRPLTVTPRADLRPGAGVNTKFWLDPSPYTLNQVPNQQVLSALPPSGLSFIRERWWPNLTPQHDAFSSLTSAGMKLLMIMGDMDDPPDRTRLNVDTLAESEFAPYVIGVSGPNEANAAQDKEWPSIAVAIQERIYKEVYKYPEFAAHVAILGPALMHNNVKNLDHDYRALHRAGIRRWCDAGDFHFYPGNAGPLHNVDEEQRAREAFGKLPMWMTETGWTGADTPPVPAGRFTVEAILRNHLAGIVGTAIYEFVDEEQYVSGREGLFGMETPTAPKPAYIKTQTLLATPDGNEAINGYLADYSTGVPSDAGVVVTSEGGGRWTVYLMQEQQDSATIVIRKKTGTNQYPVQFTDTLMIVHVSDH